MADIKDKLITAESLKHVNDSLTKRIDEIEVCAPGVHIGDEAPVDGQVVWIDTDEQPENSDSGGTAQIDVVAKVGQVIAVKSVDENSKPKEYKAVDLPTVETPDLNANEGEPGYIANRTHYIDKNGVVHKLDNKFIDADWMATSTEQGGTIIHHADIAFKNNTAYLSENGGSFKVDAGIDVDVYWNGVKYVCSLKLHDEEPYIGNGSLGLYGAPNTGEPFCLYGSFLAPDTIAYVKKDTTTAENIELLVTVKSETVYNKLPKEYLPDDIGGGLEPLIGTTDEITPTQVAQAVAEGRAVAITHTQDNTGTFVFNSFAISNIFGVVYAANPVDGGEVIVSFGLYGHLSNNTWTVDFTHLANKSDIPDAVINPPIAEVGQTIIVKEVDENGKPTKWESAEYQPRTHWSENRTLVFPIPDVDLYKLIGGDYYVVVADGVEYVCECKFAIDYNDGVHYLGNPKWAGGMDNGMPFAIVREYNGNIYFYGSLSSDSTSIYHIDVNKIPAEYLPKNLPQVRYSETVICENVTVTTTDLMGNGMPIGVIPSITSNPLKEGVIYDVIWNGTKYSCEPFLFDDGVLAIGNRIMQLSNGMDTGEPFVMSFAQGMFGAFAKEFATFTISIIEHTPIVQKLGDEYYDKALFVDIFSTGNDDDEGNPILETDITPEVLRYAFNRNIPIFAKIEGILEINTLIPLTVATTFGSYGAWSFTTWNGQDNSIMSILLDKSETNDAFAVHVEAQMFSDLVDKRLKELGIIT